jgi:uncharacterized protein YndB with AHSA1/START domain
VHRTVSQGDDTAPARFPPISPRNVQAGRYVGDVITLERTVTVDRPVDRVAAYLTDFTNTTDWDPGSLRTDRVEGDGGTGTVYRNVSAFAGRTTELTYVVTELAPGERITLRGENKTVVAHDTMTFSGDAHRTQVTYVATFEFKGVARLLEPALRIPMKRLGDEAETGMREALERL